LRPDAIPALATRALPVQIFSGKSTLLTLITALSIDNFTNHPIKKIKVPNIFVISSFKPQLYHSLETTN